MSMKTTICTFYGTQITKEQYFLLIDDMDLNKKIHLVMLGDYSSTKPHTYWIGTRYKDLSDNEDCFFLTLGEKNNYPIDNQILDKALAKYDIFINDYKEIIGSWFG